MKRGNSGLQDRGNRMLTGRLFSGFLLAAVFLLEVGRLEGA